MAFKFCWPVTGAHKYKTHTHTHIHETLSPPLLSLRLARLARPQFSLHFISFHFVAFRFVCFRFIALTTATHTLTHSRAELSRAKVDSSLRCLLAGILTSYCRIALSSSSRRCCLCPCYGDSLHIICLAAVCPARHHRHRACLSILLPFNIPTTLTPLWLPF